MNRRRPPIPPIPLALAAIAVFALIVYAAFAKRLPFTDGYRVEAVFTTSTGLREGAPVRIAGVTVGEVAELGPGPGTTRVVTLELDDEALPVHRDAMLKIRPRLFLEGGFYVQLEPGTPSAPELRDGGTIPLAQTAVPVQISDVLNTFDRNTRDSLKSSLRETDTAFGGGAADAFRGTARELAPAYRDAALVAEAARGLRPHDLSDALRDSSRLTAALASRDRQLADLITNWNVTTGALASEGDALAAGIHELAGLVRETPPQLDLIDRALPPLTRIGSELRPALRIAPPILDGLDRLLVQVDGLSRPGELPRLLDLAEPAAGRLPSLQRALRDLFPDVTPVTDCVRDRIAPVLEAKLDDGELSTGRPVWQDLVHSQVGAAGASGFDANGPWLRMLGSLNEGSVALGSSSSADLFGLADEPLLGTRPAPVTGGRPSPLRPDAECREQRPVDVQARTGPPLPQSRSRARAPHVSREKLVRAFGRLASGDQRIRPTEDSSGETEGAR